MFELSQTEPSLFLVSSLFPHTYKKKRGASYRNSSRSLRPSHCPYSLNEQRKKAPRRYVYIYMPQKYLYTEKVHRYNEGINIPLSYLPLQCSLAVLQSLRSSKLP